MPTWCVSSWTITSNDPSAISLFVTTFNDAFAAGVSASDRSRSSMIKTTRMSRGRTIAWDTIRTPFACNPIATSPYVYSPEICTLSTLLEPPTRCKLCNKAPCPPDADEDEDLPPELSSAVRLHLCKNCKNVSYCSKRCQKKHWAAHKSHCHPSSVSITIKSKFAPPWSDSELLNIASNFPQLELTYRYAERVAGIIGVREYKLARQTFSEDITIKANSDHSFLDGPYGDLWEISG